MNKNHANKRFLISYKDKPVVAIIPSYIESIFYELLFCVSILFVLFHLKFLPLLSFSYNVIVLNVIHMNFVLKKLSICYELS